jgi:hypothetical protein
MAGSVFPALANFPLDGIFWAIGFSEVARQADASAPFRA